MLKAKILEYLNKYQKPVIGRLSQNLAQSRLISLGLGYLPHSDSAINSDAIEMILNDIIVNRRMRIVEFGSGLSTIYIAKLLSKDREKECIFYSFEHDIAWVQVVNRLLKQEKISDYVRIVHAPLSPSHEYYKDTSREFYSPEVIRSSLSNINDIDCVIIDGPPAYMQGGGLSRLPALPALKEWLSDEFSCFLDDVNRDGEKEILEHYKSKFSLDYIKVKSNMAYMRKGKGFTVTTS